jgi:hypothetical protein
MVLFKFVGYLVFDETPVNPFVWCAVGAHETPATPNAPNYLLAEVFPEFGSGTARSASRRAGFEFHCRTNGLAGECVEHMLCLLDRASDGFSRLGPISRCMPTLSGISPGTKAKPPVVVWPTALLCGPLLTVFPNRKAPRILYAER